MKLTVTMPFIWNGKSYAVGDQVEDAKIIAGMREGLDRPDPADKKTVHVAPVPRNHFVISK